MFDSLIKQSIKGLQAYHVPNAKGMIKLDAMENPYCLPAALQKQLAEALAVADINRYPDPTSRELTATLKLAMDVPNEANVLLGNGSDEIIQIIAMAVAEPGRLILAPEPSFSMYRMIALCVGVRYAAVPLCNDFGLNLPQMLRAIKEQQPAVVFIAYPNNPSGNLFDREGIKAIIELSSGLVVVDEAYHAFADDSFMRELAHYPNLLVLRTVSKMGLAGLRLGLLAAHPELIDAFNKVRLPYNINVLTQISAKFAFDHKHVFDQQTAQIKQDRSILFEALSCFSSLRVFPSQANFILFKTEPGKSETVFAALKSDGILLKTLNKQAGLLTDCLRVTVGTPEENAKFLASLEKVLDRLKDSNGVTRQGAIQ